MLATLLRHMWKVTKKRIRLHIRWIHKRRGEHHHRSPGRCWHVPGTTASFVSTDTVNEGSDEEGFIEQIVSIQRETTSCHEALRTRWTGPTDFFPKDGFRLAPSHSGTGDAHNSHCVGRSEARKNTSRTTHPCNDGSAKNLLGTSS